jgi:hypothetical protein
MWVGDVVVRGRTVARWVPWAGSLASGRPSVSGRSGVPQLQGVPAIWADGFTYAYPPGYDGDAVITTGDSTGLAIALFVIAGLMLVGSIAWGAAAISR